MVRILFGQPCRRKRRKLFFVAAVVVVAAAGDLHGGVSKRHKLKRQQSRVVSTSLEKRELP